MKSRSREAIPSAVPARRGFTIVELLVSIAIIFVLITSAAVALRLARKNAARTETLNALRQMMMGYSEYTADNKGRLMPGYVDPSLIGPDSNHLIRQVRTRSGVLLTPEDCSSFVWRLAPYLNDAWPTYLADYREATLVSKLSSEYDSGTFGPGTASSSNDFGIGNIPSIGLNSMFVGGDDTHGGPGMNGTEPWNYVGSSFELRPVPPRIAAVRVSEVKSPSKLIVFAPVQAESPPQNSAYNVVMGAPELRAPYLIFNPDNVGGGDWSERQWFLDTDNRIVPDPGAVYAASSGFPIDRLNDGKFPAGHLDGSTRVFNVADFVYIADDQGDSAGVAQMRRNFIMSHWSPFHH